MADQADTKSAKDSKQPFDLSELSGLDFGPNWAAERENSGGRKNAGPSGKAGQGGQGGQGGKGGYDAGKGGRRPRGGPRDRRAGGGPNEAGGGDRPPRRDGTDDRTGPGGPRARGARGAQGGPRGSRGDFGRRASAPAPYEPTVKVDLYPQDEAFDALINRLRSSARTYELFDIAQLLLEKPDRFVVVVAPLSSKGAGPSQLYYSVPGHLPFESEEAAVSFVVSNHLDLFFDVEEIEIDPPKGNFQMVNRCTITGKLLGPPNYHRYQEFLRHHYATQITGMSFERFTSKIEGVKEPEQIEAWLDSMKKSARYTLKSRQEGEPEAFDSLEAARFFLLQHRKDQVVGSGESVRFAGRDIERLPRGAIRSSVEAHIEKQKVFPLESANNIRGRLRRHKFAVYKKGSKGVSFVCAVKRKFRDSKTLFTDSIRDLIEFIEKHPEMPASKLPKAYIGIDTEKQKPEALKMTEAEVEAAAQAKAAAESTAAQAKAEAEATAAAAVAVEATTGAEAQAAATGAEPPTIPPATSKEPEADRSAEVPTEPTKSPSADRPSAIAEDAKASTEAKPKVELTEAESKKLRQLMGDLRWLITEGYVTEYGDGRLFAPPPMPEAKPKEMAAAPEESPTDEPEAAEPEAAEPEAVEPETAEPETVEPEAAEPETVEPEAAEQGSVVPKTSAGPEASEIPRGSSVPGQ